VNATAGFPQLIHASHNLLLVRVLAEAGIIKIV
jgi:hypothetical protein